MIVFDRRSRCNSLGSSTESDNDDKEQLVDELNRHKCEQDKFQDLRSEPILNLSDISPIQDRSRQESIDDTWYVKALQTSKVDS